jgi:hypothetical protein
MPKDLGLSRRSAKLKMLLGDIELPRGCARQLILAVNPLLSVAKNFPLGLLRGVPGVRCR